MSKETEIKKILEDYLETIYQKTEGSCPICFAPDYPVNGDKSGYEDVSPEDAEEWQCDHDENCAVTVITKFLTAWNTREEKPNCIFCDTAQGEVADLQSRLTAAERKLALAEKELKRLKGDTCICMDCGKIIKTAEQSKHDKKCKKEKP